MSKKNKEEPVRVGLSIIMVREGKVLLGRRLNTETFPNTLAYPGGRMDYGETPEQGIIRETKEECDIDLDPDELSFFNYVNEFFPEENKHYVNMVFVSTRFKGEPRVMEPNKCESWEWYDPFDLPEDTFINIKDNIKNNQSYFANIILTSILRAAFGGE